MALNQSLYRFLGVSAFVVCVLFVLFAFLLYRSGGNYLAAVVVAAFEATAGVYLLKKSKMPTGRR